MNNSTAIFYSEKANIILASQVKESLNKFNIFTVYLKDIDDILLKKLTQIDILVLDFTENELDEKSKQLLRKLNEEQYIKRIIIIRNKNDNLMEDVYPTILLDNNFISEFNKNIKTILSKPLEERKICDAYWVKIIGNYLSSIGFSLKQTGYSMMIDAIVYIMSKNGIVGKLNEDIYVYLSNKYGKKVSCVEMNLRKSIRIAFERSKNFPFDYCPTNKEFMTFAVTELYDKIYIKEVI